MHDFLVMQPRDLELPHFETLDATLRDGGFQVNFQWSRDEMVAIAGAALSAGCAYSELGYAGGVPDMQNVDVGFSADLTADDVRAIAQGIEHKYGIATEGRLAIMLAPAVITDDIPLKALKDAGIELVRFVYHKLWHDKLAHLHEQCREAGLKTSINVALASRYELQELKDAVRDVMALKPDLFYLADTCGGLLPNDVESVYRVVNECWALYPGIQTGFHAHDHTGSALANALAAVGHGVHFIDATVCGLGKSAGNLRMELLFVVLQARVADARVDTESLEPAIEIITHKDGPSRRLDMASIVLGAGNFTPPMEAALRGSDVSPANVLPFLRHDRRPITAILQAIDPAAHGRLLQENMSATARQVTGARLFGSAESKGSPLDLRTFDREFFAHVTASLRKGEITLSTDLNARSLETLSVHGHPVIDRDHRKAVADRFNLQPDSIIATAGASHALDVTLSAVTSAGTKVLLPHPYFPSYQQLVELRGGVPIYYSATDENQALDDIKGGFADGATAIVINQPNNPTGVLFSRETVNEMSRLARSNGAFAVWDKTYSWMTAEGDHAEGDENIVIYSLGKWTGLTGLRAGIVSTSNAAFLDVITQIKIATTFSTSQLDTHVANAFLRARPSLIQRHQRETLASLSARRDELAGVLDAIGIDDSNVRGGLGYTVFLNDQDIGADRRQLIGVDGASFGLPGHSRYCLGVSNNKWQAMLDRLRAGT